MQDAGQATFAPKIDPVSQVIASTSLDSRVKVEERLIDKGRVATKKKQLSKMLEEEHQRKMHPFVPQVDRV